MSIEDNIAGRLKATAAIDLLMADLSDSEVRAAMATLRKQADSILGPPPDPEHSLSRMEDTEARAFQSKLCAYEAHRGEPWRDVPREYIAIIADFGLELQRYLRSEIGKNHR
jgi:hypothetical protein